MRGPFVGDPNFHKTAKDAPDRLSERDVEAWEN